jgi:phage recombination protein Bet
MAIQDKTTPQTGQQVAVRDDQKLISVSPGRPPYPIRAQAAFGISPGDWRALVDAIYPNAKTTEAIELALTYCRARKLDPFKRQCHIVPIWDSKKGAEIETIWPGISELRTTAVRTNQFAGFDEALFGPDVPLTFKGTVGKGQYAKEVEKDLVFPAWCQVTVYRIVQGQRCAFPGPKVRWMETYATMGASDVPNEMWATRPYGQLEKCAEAAALRRAFPEEIGSDYIPEEVGRIRAGATIDVTPAGPPGSKTRALADRLKAGVRGEPEDQGQEEEPGENGAGEYDRSPVGEPLSPAQVIEIRAAIKRAGISLDELEGRYGDDLAEIIMPGMDAKALEADIVRTIRELADAAKGEGQLPLGKK